MTPSLARKTKSSREFGLGNQNGQGTEPEGWFLGLTAISNQAADQIDQEIGWTSVTRMFNLRDALELANNRLDNGTFAKQDFIHQRHESVFHVGARFAQGKKNHGGSTPKSYFGMSLAFPFKKIWLRLGRAEENALCSSVSHMINALFQLQSL